MTSIRNFDGEIFLCTACGQPCYEEDSSDPKYDPYLMHFDEQWDGVYCRMHPLAVEKLVVDWDPISLDELKEKYPNTHPSRYETARWQT